MIICAFDTETTGLSETDRVVEFGAVVMDTDLGEVIFTENVLFKIPFKMSEEVMRIHGIKNEDLEHGVLFESYAKRAHKILSRPSLLIGHNILFDIRMMSAEFARCGMAFPDNEFGYIDTIAVCRRFFPNDIAPRKSLGEMSKFLELGEFNAHRASEDAAVTLKLFIESCKKIGLSIEEMVDKNVNCVGNYCLGMDPFESVICGFMSSSVYES